jgi:hypothetical protein
MATPVTKLKLPWGGWYTPKNPKEHQLIKQYFRGLWTEEEIMRKLGLGPKLFRHRSKGLPHRVVRLVLKLKGKTYRNPYIPKNPQELVGFNALAKAMLVGKRKGEVGGVAVEKPGVFDRTGRQEYEHLPPKEIVGFYPRESTEALLEMVR